MRRWFAFLTIVSLAIAAIFLLLPIVALFTRVEPADLAAALTGAEARRALGVTLRTSLVAHLLILGLGTPAAYLLATRSFRGRRVAIALIELPLVLPPVVAGIALLAAFGRLGLLGRELQAVGISIPFTEVAVVMAVCFVAGPLYLRQAVASFEGVDRSLIDAARTLGASPARVFARVALPLASAGLAAGSGLALARGLGEFGATIVFAGSFPGVTQTMPLAIYAGLDRDLGLAVGLGIVLLLVSAAVLVAVRSLGSWVRY